MAAVAGEVEHPDRDMGRIRDGVFFTMPADLPRGRHELGREKVLEVHRERCMIAATELLASLGYQAFGVRDICARAGISLGAFYRCFDDREACVFAAYDRFIAVLSERLRNTPRQTGVDPARQFLREYLSALGSDPVVARSFQVEMEALGREARNRRKKALHGLAETLHSERSQWVVSARGISVESYLAAIYAVRQLAADCLDEGGDPDFSRFLADADRWMLGMLTR